MTQKISAVWPGRTYPRGATWDGEGVNFALFSEHAEKVVLCLFDPAGKREVQRIEFREQTDMVWHCYLPEARPGLLYGYRVHGAIWGDAAADLSFLPGNCRLVDALAGTSFDIDPGQPLSLAQLLAHFPVAILHGSVAPPAG